MKNWKSAILFVFVSSISVLIVFNAVTAILYRSSPKDSERNSIETNPGNPYRQKTKLRWVKSAFHNHTNEVWYTPGRNSVDEIEKVYLKHGYRILSFSDYERITLPKNGGFRTLSGFEWGTNLRKRHILVLGAAQPEFDPFPLYADVPNIQWAIDRFRGQGAFVTINHPELNRSFPLKTLKELRDYDSIEVFSPFGDELASWDEILSEGKFPHCMASDDLHYLPKDEYETARDKTRWTLRDLVALLYRPEGQSLMRYVLLNTESLEAEDILRSLKSGNYACVRKHDRILPDPKLKDMGVDDGNRVFFEFGEEALKVDFIGKRGGVIKEIRNVKRGSYPIPPGESYLRLQILFPSALVISNPISVSNLRRTSVGNQTDRDGN
ncbi:phosphoesterase [Leptospira ellisii]|uniref:Phosphoesterase n=1 Tax=Leptospira ellisii TaxID=2023197 RepID=A0A2N0BLW9_9LEPT|nr:phosphoesterase [Leptospira ellisii]MDV6235662.1 phosphoesterase [Leptospira ellisii]PJZ92727.1 phosphoesterase [Leptospira ellisii]PKA04997.1 phosphoesterase [Leptospira ellisii]